MTRCEENVALSQIRKLNRRAAILEGKSVKGKVVPDKQILRRAIWHLNDEAQCIVRSNIGINDEMHWEASEKDRYDEIVMIIKRLRQMVKP